MAFGGETGFLVGAMTMLASNVLFSQGPWTPFQMFSMGIIGFLAGVLFRKGWLRRSRGALAVFGGIVTFVIYGAIMNPVSALIYGAEMNWQTLLTYYITGFPMDCVHACATVIFLLLLADHCWKSWTASVKYGLVGVQRPMDTHRRPAHP
ncbi:MAG: ECF transporter S component [Oscillospiraceae bacterium]